MAVATMVASIAIMHIEVITDAMTSAREDANCLANWGLAP
jgi:hypothetical protein